MKEENNDDLHGKTLKLLMDCESQNFIIHIEKTEDGTGFEVHSSGNPVAQLIALKRVERDLLDSIVKGSDVKAKTMKAVVDSYILFGKAAEIINKNDSGDKDE